MAPTAPKAPKTSDSDFCKIADPLYFDTEAVVDWLYENDPAILKGIVVHNEQVAALCG